jgi:uncharacterized protein (UPF0332 family)
VWRCILTKQGFLKKLYNDKDLQLVAPNDVVKVAYLKKSDSFLASARLLRDNERFEESVSLTYYSMYYSVLALFFATGIKCENHSATIILLDEIFGIDNSAIKSAKSERIDKQYYVATAPVRSEVISLIKTAELFNAGLLDVVDRLTKDKIDAFRKKLIKLIG